MNHFHFFAPGRPRRKSQSRQGLRWFCAVVVMQIMQVKRRSLSFF
jgi:hypothetical protein